MTPTQIIQAIHENARRPEIHLRPADYRAAVDRESVWVSLTSDEKRSAITLAEGELCLLDVVLEDIKETRSEAAKGAN